jgi:hypothetical protein
MTSSPSAGRSHDRGVHGRSRETQDRTAKVIGDSHRVPLPIFWTREGDVNMAPPASIIDPDATERSRFIRHAAIAAVRAATGV